MNFSSVLQLESLWSSNTAAGAVSTDAPTNCPWNSWPLPWFGFGYDPWHLATFTASRPLSSLPQAWNGTPGGWKHRGSAQRRQPLQRCGTAGASGTVGGKQEEPHCSARQPSPNKKAQAALQAKGRQCLGLACQSANHRLNLQGKQVGFPFLFYGQVLKGPHLNPPLPTRQNWQEYRIPAQHKWVRTAAFW